MEAKALEKLQSTTSRVRTTQHRLLVADVEQAPNRKKKWVAKKKRIKWWKLNSNDPDVKIEVEKFAESAKEKLRCINEEMSVEEVWAQMEKAIRETAKDVLGESKGA